MVFSREVFVVCRRESDRGLTNVLSDVVDCVKIRLQYLDLILFPSDFGCRNLPPLLSNGVVNDGIFQGGVCGVWASQWQMGVENCELYN